MEVCSGSQLFNGLSSRYDVSKHQLFATIFKNWKTILQLSVSFSRVFKVLADFAERQLTKTTVHLSATTVI